jgi:hypothetical protein
MKKLSLFLIIGVLVVLSMSGCADVINVKECIKPSEHVYGFWGGTWHGMISWFSFIGSLFSDDIAVYAINNNGSWYNFGFVGGLFFILRIFAQIIKSLSEIK